MRSQEQIKAAIKAMESNWKMTIGESKKHYWRECQELYKELKELQEKEK